MTTPATCTNSTCRRAGANYRFCPGCNLNAFEIRMGQHPPMPTQEQVQAERRARITPDMNAEQIDSMMQFGGVLHVSATPYKIEMCDTDEDEVDFKRESLDDMREWADHAERDFI